MAQNTITLHAGVTELTAKGDLLVFGTVNARLPVGADTFILTADSTEPLGVKWAASAAGVTDHTLLTNIGTHTHAQLDSHVDVATEALSTGLNEGGVLSINGGDAAKFDISAGSGIVVDHSTSPPTYTEVSWTAFTAQTLTNLATSFATDIAINAAGAIVQQNSFTDEELRDYIFLGGIDHNNQTTIDDTFSIVVPTKAVMSSVRELSKAIGDINLSGNLYSANGANLNIDKSVGSVFSYGRNYLTNVDSPHKIVTASETVVSFGYVFNDGTGNGDFTVPGTAVDPDQYDNGTGTLASVGVNDWTIQRVLLFPNANKTFIQYGVTTYNKLNEALDAVPRQNFVALAGITTALVRGYIIVQQGETDLTNATFLSADRFGTVASLSSGIDVSLSELTDTIITGITSGEILKWNGSEWVNNTLAEAGVTAVGHTHTASEITDFDTEVSNNVSVAANTAKVTYPGPAGSTTEIQYNSAGVMAASADFTYDGSNVTLDGDYVATAPGLNIEITIGARGTNNNFPRATFLTGNGTSSFTNASVWMMPDLPSGVFAPMAFEVLNGTDTGVATNRRLYFQQDASAAKVVTMSGTGSGLGTNIYFSAHQGTTNPDQITLLNTGLVGINKLVPVQQLDVNGDAAADAWITNSGTASQFVKGDGTLDSSTYLTTAVTNLGYTASPTDGTVTSDTGTDATLTLATGVNAGLLSPADFTILSNTSGTNSGDNAVNTLYSGLVSNATHTGDVTGSTVLTIAAGAVDLAMLSATGTPSASNFLRGDYTWATPAGSGNVSTSGVPVLNDFARFVGATDIEGRSYAEVRADLSLEVGTDIQAWSAALDAVTGTNTGDQTSIVGITGTKAQFDTALTDDNFAYRATANTFTATQSITVTGDGLDITINGTGNEGLMMDFPSSSGRPLTIYDNGTFVGGLDYNFSGNYFSFDVVNAGLTRQTDAFVIMSETNNYYVGVGTTTTTERLTVEGNIAVSGTVDGIDIGVDVAANTAKVSFPGFTSLAADYGFTDNSANWDTAYTNRITSLTTTGTSGAATLISNVLNIPNYADTVYTHPNHTGHVTSTGDGATVLTVAAITGQTATTTLAGTDEFLVNDGGVIRRVDMNRFIVGQAVSLTSGLAGSDELLVSDNGALKKMDVIVIQAYMQNNLTFPGATTEKALTIEDPVSGDDIAMFFTDVAITVTQINDVLVGSTSVTWNIYRASTRNAAGTKIFTSDRVTSSLTGAETTTINSASIAAGSWVWYKASAASGTPTQLTVSMTYTID